MLVAASGKRALRRVVWRHLGSDSRLEFCEAAYTDARLDVTGHVLGDTDATPAYASYELMCSTDLTRCMALRLECVWKDTKRTLTLQQESAERWFRNGMHAPELDGCTDPDLEWSPSTNTFPMRRLEELARNRLQVRAAWIRIPTLIVQPVTQTYTRVDARRYQYRNEASGYESHIDVDELGLPLTYEGVWTRTADWSAQ